MSTGPSSRNPPAGRAAACLDVLLSHRRTVFVLWIAASVVMAALSTRLRVDGRLEALVPETGRDVAEHVEALRRLGASEMVYVDVSADDRADVGADDRANHRANDRGIVATGEAVASRLQASGLFREVFGRATPETIARTFEVVAGAAPLYLEPADYEEIAAATRGDALADRVEAQVARLLEPGGAAGESRVRRDPLDIAGLALRRALGGVAAGATSSTSKSSALPAPAGLPVSADGRHVLVAALASAPMGDEAAGEAIANLLDSVARDLPAGARIEWIGGHRFYRANSQSLRADIAMVSVVGFVLVVLLVVLGYPGLRSAALAGIAGVMAGLAGASVVVLAFGPVSGVALAFGGALSGICVDCVLHLRAVPLAGESREASVRRTFAAVAPSVTIGALTSVAAFLVLLASPVEVHRQIGVAGAAGIVGAAAFALCVGPILAAGPAAGAAVVGEGGSVGAPVPHPRRARFEVVSGRVWRLVLARPRAWFLGTAAVIALSAAVLPQIGFESDLRRFESKDAATLAAEREFSRTWGALLARSLLVVRAADVEAALVQTEDLLAEIAPADVPGAAEGWTSAVRALPSRRTQDARWAAWTAFWTAERCAALRRDLAAASEPLGVAAAAFDPFFDGLLRRPPPLDVATLRSTALRPLVDRHLLIDDGGVRSVVSLPSDAPALAGPASRRAAIAARGVHVLSGRTLADAVVESTRSVLETLALPAVLSVALLLWAYYRDTRRAFAALVPLLGGATVAGAGLFLCGEQLSLMTLPVIVPTFGFAVDYGVFTLDALDEADAHPERGDAILAERGAGVLGAALTTASGGFAMLVAAHPAVRSIGLALVWSVLSCMAVAWAGLPGMLRWWGPRR